MEDEQCSSPSLKHKLKQTLCLSCCFRDNRREPPESPNDDRRRLMRTSSLWLKSRAQELPEIRDKCRHLISRIGRHRRPVSGDFRYDPLSYALNFDGGYDDALADEAPLRNFSARLPASPPPPPMSAEIESVVAPASREIAAVS